MPVNLSTINKGLIDITQAYTRYKCTSTHSFNQKKRLPQSYHDWLRPAKAEALEPLTYGRGRLEERQIGSR